MFDTSASRMLQSVQNSAQPATQQWLQPPSSVTSSSDQTQSADSDQQQDAVIINDKQKLDAFESVLSEIEAEKQTVQSPPQTPQPVSYSPTINKEQAPGMPVSVELPGGMQYVESEPELLNPEIPAEVESFLQKVEERPTQLPQEIVIAAQEHAASQPRNLPQDVKVLPITAAQAEVGKKKSTSFSIRWLVTFSEKLSEMFKGKAVYRNE